MTSLSTAIPDVTRLGSTAFSPYVNRTLIDQAVADGRAAREPGVESLRSAERLSVSELNALDLDSVRERMARSRPDSRSPVVKALDLVDLPRNAMANIIFRGTAREVERTDPGDVGTFGMSRVQFSDVLRNMGVENRVARGIIGFVGDVAFDPLTYVGGTGLGLRLAGKTGTSSLRLGVSGSKRLRAVSKAVAKGEEVRDPLMRELVDSVRGVVAEQHSAISREILTDEKLNRLTADALAGSVGGGAKGQARTILDRLGVEITREGSIIPELVRDVKGLNISANADEALKAAGRLAEVSPARARAIEKAKEFYVKYAAGVGSDVKGIKIGNGGSAIAHIPFTDTGIYVPAFTQNGRMALAGLAAARIDRGDLRGGLGLTEAMSDVESISEATKRLVSGNLTTDERESLLGVIESFRERLGSNLARSADDISDLSPAEVAGMRKMLDVAEKSSKYARVMEDQVTAGHGATAIRKVLEQRKEIARVAKAVNGASEDGDTALDLGKAAADATNDAFNRLRSGEIDEVTFEREIAAVASDRLPQAQRALFEMPADELKAIGENLEFVKDRFNSVNRLAAATNGSLVNYLNTSDKAILDLVKFNIGTTSDVVGSSLLGGFATAARSVSRNESLPGIVSAPFQMLSENLDSADRLGRRIFGTRHGDHKSLQRAYTNVNREVAALDGQAVVLDELNNMVRAIGRSQDLTADQIDQVNEAMFLLLHERVGQGQRFFATAIDGTPSVMMQKLQRVRESGILQNKEIASELGKSVETFAGVLDDLARRGDDMGLLDSFISAYVPVSLTRRAQELAGARASSVSSTLAESIRRQAGDTVTEGFQRARHTLQYRFLDANGRAVQLFEGDFMGIGKLSESQIRQMDSISDQAKAELLRIRGHIDQWNEVHGSPDASVRRSLGRPTDPWELNSEPVRGRFALLLGLDGYSDDIFDTRIAPAMTNRIASQKRAESYKQFTDIMRQTGVPVLNENLIVGKTAVLPNGVSATVLSADNGSARVKIGQEVYRTISLKDADKSPLLAEMASSGGTQMLYPERAAEHIEAALKATSRASLGAVTEFTDRTTSIWSTTTLASPSWVVLNIIGTAVLAMQGGANLAKTGNMFGHAIKAMTGKFDGERTIELAGRSVSMSGVVDNARAGGVIGSRQSEILDRMSDIGLLRPREINPTQGGVRGIRQAAGQAKVQFSQEVQERMQDIALSAGRGPNGFDKIRAMGGILVSERMIARMMQPFFKANRVAEDSMRLAVYMSFLDDGLSEAEAAQKTIVSLFDYADLTPIEQNVRRFAAPFYAWIRHNMGYQIHQFVTDPKQAAALPKVKTAIEEAIAGEETLPEHKRPRWMQQQMMIQFGADPERRFALGVGNFLPTAEVFNVLQGAAGGGEGFMESLGYGLASLSPIAQAGISLGQGRETFTGRTISARENEGDLSLGEYALGQIRPFRDFGNPLSPRRGSMPAAFERSTAEGIGRTLVGGRLQEFTEERIDRTLVAEFGERVQQIRRRINLAEREGNERLSLSARASLMATFEQMIEMGMEDDVPRWAREQIELLQAN